MNGADESPMSEQRQAIPPGRPAFLTFLCILTFIGSGMLTFSFFFAGLFRPMIVKITELPEFKLPGMEVFKNTPSWVFLLGAVLYAFSLAGSILIWNLRKMGFHVYTVAQIALLFLSTFLIYPGGLPSGDLLFTASFILFYGMHLRFMK